MTRSFDVDQVLDEWLGEGPSRLPDRVVAGITADLEHAAPKRHWWLPYRNHVYRNAFALAGAAVMVVVAAGVGLGLLVNRPGVAGPSPSPTATSAPTSTPTFVVGRPQNGVPIVSLGWSRDGTRLLFQKGHENLFILHADGSETQLTDQLWWFNDIQGIGSANGRDHLSRWVACRLRGPDQGKGGMALLSRRRSLRSRR